MDLKDIIAGLAWFVLGNLAMYFLYPVYGGFLDGFGTTVLGSFGLTTNMVMIGWGAYFFAWGLTGIALPIYLIVKGSSKD